MGYIEDDNKLTVFFVFYNSSTLYNTIKCYRLLSVGIPNKITELQKKTTILLLKKKLFCSTLIRLFIFINFKTALIPQVYSHPSAK